MNPPPPQIRKQVMYITFTKGNVHIFLSPGLFKCMYNTTDKQNQNTYCQLKPICFSSYKGSKLDISYMFQTGICHICFNIGSYGTFPSSRLEKIFLSYQKTRSLFTCG